MISILKKLLIAFVPIVICYLTFEIFIFKRIVQQLNIYQKKEVIKLAWPFIFKTKKDFFPSEKYNIIIGGSDALGFGDWSLQNKDYLGAGRAMLENCNTESLIYAKESAGVLQYLLFSPKLYFEYMEKIFPTTKPPKNIFIFYYPTNDVFEDNIIIKKFLTGNKQFLDLTHSEKNELYSQIKKESTLHKVSQSPLNELIFLHFLKEKILPSKAKVHQPRSWENSSNIAQIKGKEFKLVSQLQGPPHEATETELENHFTILNESLYKIRNLFPNSKIYLVHMTSPAIHYNFVSKQVSLQSYRTAFKGYYKTPNEIETLHQRINIRAKNIASKNNISFVSIHKRFKKKNRDDHLIHGPKDWQHLNEKGYRYLADELCELIQHP